VAHIERVNRILTACERALNYVACLMMFLIMIIVVIDVVLRYFFNSPLGWSYELISLYLMVGLFFFSLSDTLNANGHIAVDLLLHRMSDRLRHAADAVGYGCASLVFAGIVYMAIVRTIVSYTGDEVIAGNIAWPTWLANLLVAIGSGVMLLRMVFRFAGHLLSWAAGRSIIALPPVSGSGEAH